MATKEKNSIPFSKKRWPKIIGILAILGIGAIIALPYGISYGLERWLVNNGAQKAEIQNVDVNLFAGTAAIDGLKVTLKNDVVLGEGGLHVDLRLASLFKKEAHLQTGVLSGLILDIELSDDGSLRIGSISIPSSSGDANDKDASQETDVSWFFRASHIELTDCLLRFKMPGMTSNVFVTKATLSNLFTGVSKEPSHLELEGKINEIPIKLSLDRIEISSKTDRVVGGRIKIDGYKLSDIKGLLQGALDSFAGSVSLDGEIQAAIGDDGSFAAHYQGDLSVTDTDIGSSNFSIQGPSISYKGELQYEMDKDLNMAIDVNGILQGTDTALAVPVAGLDLLEQQLQLDGKTQITISKDIDIAVATDADLTLGTFTLNLPPMKVNNSALDWQGHVEYKLAADSGSQSVNADGKIVLQKTGYSITSTDFSMNTTSENLSWQGKVDIDLGSKQSPMTITADGTFIGSSHQLAIADLLDLKEDTLSSDGTTVVTIGNKTKVAHTSRKMQLDNSVVTVAGTTNSGSFSWQGEADYTLDNGTSKIFLDGTLQGTELESLLAEQKILIKQQDLKLITQKVGLTIGDQLKVSGKASLAADKLEVIRDDVPLLQLKKTAVNGLTGIADGGLQIDSATLSNLEVPAAPEQPITVSVPEITLKNLASTDFTGATVDSIQIQSPTVRDTKANTLLAKIENLTGSTIKVEQPLKITMTSFSSGKGTFVKKDGKKNIPMATLGELQMKTISWSADDGFFCDTIALDSLMTDYVREKSTGKKETKEKESKTTKKKEAEPAGAPAVKINSIVVTGKSGFKFIDHTTTTGPFTTTLDLKTLQVKKIDLSRPEQPFTFELKGKFDKYAPLDITGSSALFAKTLLVQANIHLRNYSLQRLSPYVTDAIGTKFVKGQMSVTSELNISGDKLDLKNNFVLQQIKAETVSEELLDKLNNELPVSLDMALSMLRDSNGDIDLNVPISGPLDHLSVNPTDIIVTALSKAIVIAVTPYLAYTVLGPAGALAYVGLKAGGAMIDLSLPSLEFDNQAVELTDAHKEILEKIGKGMENHKDKDYSICSRVLLWELSGDVERTNENQQKILKDDAMRKKLLAIAGTRAANVKAYLLKTFSLDKDHLLVCSPGINFDPKGKPMVGFRE